ncbi:hypothetical protein P1X14_01155 [Sphingomonas sp. AOB5]|uniref:hypothetical protein n=1 Tax=Sphingomonas sp. AOB5 TaxID=3034017 RepID=UPI0023F947A9|nr:hypothetical protein [Sphingomonas sp. AOB5]MDF7773841.1 hypothetical protein [Sphingomonas sp. AOB5]
MNNADVIKAELDWLEACIGSRLNAYGEAVAIDLPPAPPLVEAAPGYAGIVARLCLADEARLLLILALAPHVAPNLLDSFMIENSAIERRFTEFGGFIDPAGSGFRPTCQTACFLVAGDDIAQSLRFQAGLKSHPLIVEDLVRFDRRDSHEPLLSARLIVPEDAAEQMLFPG